jgi:hypothetical protein
MHITLISLTLESLDAILKCSNVENQYANIIQNMFYLEDTMINKMKVWKKSNNSTVSKMASKVLKHLKQVKVLYLHASLFKVLSTRYYADCILIVHKTS